jgi:hydrogenase nickel incorporation protein HypB
MMSVRIIDVRERVMEKNDEIARDIRARRTVAGVPAINLVSSPGAGKTFLLERTLDLIGDDLRIALVTGDVQTHNDARRLAEHTSALVQAVVTNGGCHLDARQIDHALDAIDLEETDLLVIENVGNLVCPASWDLGEDAKVVLLSVTEGDDKPEKYPKIFRQSDYALITKTDLLPHVPFDMDRAVHFMRQANPAIEVMYVSAMTGDGMDDWCDMLRALAKGAARPVPSAAR